MNVRQERVVEEARATKADEKAEEPAPPPPDPVDVNERAVSAVPTALDAEVTAPGPAVNDDTREVPPLTPRALG